MASAFAIALITQILRHFAQVVIIDSITSVVGVDLDTSAKTVRQIVKSNAIMEAAVL